MARSLYYALRPFLPVSIRRHIQRAYLSGWKEIQFPQWPVDRTVEQCLERLLALSMKAQGVQTVPFVWFWPDGAPSCTIMTHDVEHLAGRNFCSQLMDLDDCGGDQVGLSDRAGGTLSGSRRAPRRDPKPRVRDQRARSQS